MVEEMLYKKLPRQVFGPSRLSPLLGFVISMFIYFGDRERQSMKGGRAEREGDTESETGSRL